VKEASTTPDINKRPINFKGHCRRSLSTDSFFLLSIAFKLIDVNI
jgi:hypothetical protein